MEKTKQKQKLDDGGERVSVQNAFALLESDAEREFVGNEIAPYEVAIRGENEVYGSCDNVSLASVESLADSARLSDCCVVIDPIPDKFWKKKSTKRRLVSRPESASSDEASPAPDVLVAKRGKGDTMSLALPSAGRGRGRPPTTGKYVGLGKAQAELNALRQEALREEARQNAEKEVSSKVAYLKTTRKVAPPTPVENSGLASDMVKQVTDAADVILTVATKSGNLKGTFTKALKDSTASIKAAVEALAVTTASEETAKLQADNASLRAEVVQLRKELAELRAMLVRDPEELPSVRVSHSDMEKSQSTPRGDNNFEEMARAIMLQVGNMINARFEGMEERLLPEKRTRPPLAADKCTTAPTQPEKTKEAEPQAPPPQIRSKKKNKKGNVADTQGSQNTQPQETTTSTPEAANEGWNTVTKRGKKGPVKSKPTPKAKAERRPSAAKLRAPRSAAVVIKLQPGAEEKGLTYANVIKEAKGKVDLASCGIASLRFRQALTGARILQVSEGELSAEKADTLAQKLRAVLGDETVKVSRPIKCADFRILGLDDSVTKEDLVSAIAQQGGCPEETVKVGDIKRTYQGTGVVMVSCPVAAAKKLGVEGRLLVGWVSARVELIQPWPLRCYRCHQNGHVIAQCTAEVDRSDECYHCGGLGHKSSGCTAPPNCSLCAAANKPAAHRLGSKVCAAPKARRYKAASMPDAATSASSCPPSQAGEARVHMETS